MKEPRSRSRGRGGETVQPPEAGRGQCYLPRDLGDSVQLLLRWSFGVGDEVLGSIKQVRGVLSAGHGCRGFLPGAQLVVLLLDDDWLAGLSHLDVHVTVAVVRRRAAPVTAGLADTSLNHGHSSQMFSLMVYFGFTSLEEPRPWISGGVIIWS